MSNTHDLPLLAKYSAVFIHINFDIVEKFYLHFPNSIHQPKGVVDQLEYSVTCIQANKKKLHTISLHVIIMYFLHRINTEVDYLYTYLVYSSIPLFFYRRWHAPRCPLWLCWRPRHSWTSQIRSPLNPVRWRWFQHLLCHHIPMCVMFGNSVKQAYKTVLSYQLTASKTEN